MQIATFPLISAAYRRLAILLYKLFQINKVILSNSYHYCSERVRWQAEASVLQVVL